ncbi:PDR/VanB family oxidoreductase [Azohydromonas aeria]|uniref:PDR/VanB family oxidoreductase n=1 Tax=Azohydromonas aeria TaxID=2590212 RepID=UPI0012FA18E0|nr:PDR/VanB family oxidoreductase [Azohydromonas aeria]
MTAEIAVEIRALRDVAPDMREFTLAPVDGTELPPFSAGSHVVLSLPVGGRVLRNAYSLLGDPGRRDAWRIAVRRQPDSRGGSAWLHDHARAGQRLGLTPPMNLFALVRTARRHLLVAGGIGITPILSQVRELARLGADFEVHYAWRSPAHAAYRDELEALAGARVRHFDASRGERLDFPTLLAEQPLGTHLYVCGPASMVEDALAAGAALGWPATSLHSERFLAPAGGQPFDVRLARSGLRLTVPAEMSLLEALERHGAAVNSLCRGGACGQCETAVLEADGELLHRDLYLGEAERRAGRSILPCVSRFEGRCLTLDL